MLYWPVSSLRLPILTILLIFLAGCGGFEEKAASNEGDSASSTVFFTGVVTLPSATANSISRSNFKLSASKSIATVPVAGAQVELYSYTDPFFENNLLKIGQSIKTNPAGEFVVTRSQVKIEALTSSQPAFIIRAFDSNAELTSILSLATKSNSTTSPVLINAISDGTVRLLKNELLQKFGGINNSEALRESAIFSQYEKFSVALAELRDQIQQEFKDVQIDRTNLLRNTPESEIDSGLLISEKITSLSTNEVLWEQLTSLREGFKLQVIANAASNASNELERYRWKTLQSLYSTLDNGFFVYAGEGNFLVKDRWLKLENREAPELDHIVTKTELESFLGLTFTQSDFINFPIPPRILNLNSALLDSFKKLGLAEEEKVVLIAHDALLSPWISVGGLRALADLDQSKQKSFSTLENLLSAGSLSRIQRRWSIQRVQPSLFSTGLAFFGAHVKPTQDLGGNDVDPRHWLSVLTKLHFESNVEDDFQSFLNYKEIYFSMLEKSYRSEYGKLQNSGKKLTDSNNGYPDPVSEQATRNLVFRIIQNQRNFANPRAERSVNLLRKLFGQIHASRPNSEALTSGTNLSSSETLALMGILPSIAWPLKSADGLFKSLGANSSGKGPNFENLGFSKLNPALADIMWNELLQSAGSAIVLTSTTDQLSIYESLAQLQSSTISYLSEGEGLATSVTVSGRVLLGRRNGQDFPGAGFLVEAIPRTHNSTAVSISSQTDSTGLFTFGNEMRLTGGQLFDFIVTVKDPGLSEAKGIPLSFSYSVTGFEESLSLPAFSLEEELLLQASTNGELEKIQPSNRPPSLTIVNTIPSPSSNIIPIKVKIIDPESDLVRITFSFQSSQSGSKTSQPRVSLSPVNPDFAISGIFDQLQSSPSGVETTLYWFTRQESAPSTKGGTENISVIIEIEESENPVVKGQPIESNFFHVDNLPPEISFDPPLRDSRDEESSDAPEESLEFITLSGRSSDRSGIERIYAQNLSYTSDPITTYGAINTGTQLSSWKIENIPVEPDITNIIAFNAIDIFGNEYSEPITASFIALDSNPPVLDITTVTVYSTRFTPPETFFFENFIRSEDDSVPFTMSYEKINANAIRYSIVTTSKSWIVSSLTTRRIEFEGRASDPGVVSKVRFNDQSVDEIDSVSKIVNWFHRHQFPLEDNENVTIRFSAVDQKNNDSNTANPNQTFKRKFGINLKFELIDLSPPSVILDASSDFSISRTQTILTTTLELSGGAADKSTISTFLLCSPSLCKNVATSNSYLIWSVSLPVSESSSNRITGVISDIFGFQEIFDGTNFIAQADINDITPPSFTLTSVDGISIPTISYQTTSLERPEAPQFFYASDCDSGLCGLTLRGKIEDESGFSLNFSDTNTNTDFNEFSLRSARLAANSNSLGEFDPNDYDETNPVGSIERLIGTTDTNQLFPNADNTSSISTSTNANGSGVVTSINFTAKLDYKGDGYWPLTLFLQDGSKERFKEKSGRTKPNIFRREILYALKDTNGPEISLRSVQDGDTATSNKVLVKGEVKDELSPIESLSVNGVSIPQSQWTSATIESPWNHFVSLDSKSAIQFATFVFLDASSIQTLRIAAVDVFGNEKSSQTTLSVLPELVKTITAVYPYQNPISLSFGMKNQTGVFVGDGDLNNIRQLNLVGSSKNTISGNSKSNFYSNITSLYSFDIYQPKEVGFEQESVVISATFSDASTNEPQIIRLFKKDGVYVSEDSKVENGYDVFRSTLVSTKSNNFSSNTIVRFSPKLESLVYVFSETSELGGNQLFRSVQGLSKETISSEDNFLGRGPTSAGRKGDGSANDHLSSNISSMVITQTLSTSEGGGVSGTFERIYLADRELQRIARFDYLNNDNLTAIAPIDLSTNSEIKNCNTTLPTITIDPTAMEVEPNGEYAYLGNHDDQKIYKLDLTSSPPCLVSSFGGHGYTEGNFLSVDYIRGYKGAEDEDFSEIYVVDKLSRRISKFTTSGVFKDFLGNNPFESGGIIEPELIGLTGNEWFLLDTALNQINFRDLASDDELSRSLGIESLELANLTSPVAFYQSELNKFEDLTNLIDSTHKTGDSSEVFRVTTRETFFLQRPDQLHYIVQSTSTSYQRTVELADYEIFPEEHVLRHESFDAAFESFDTLVDMAVVRDINDAKSWLIYVLEDKGSNINKLQLKKITNQISDADSVFTNFSFQSGTGICALKDGLVVIGNDPTNQLSYAAFSAHSKEIAPTKTFSLLNPESVQGSTLKFTNPGSPSCYDNRLALADNGTVHILKFSTIGDVDTPKVEEVLRIATSDPEYSEPLSQELEVLITQSFLYVLEKDKDRVLKFKIE